MIGHQGPDQGLAVDPVCLCRRRRRDVMIEAGSTTWLARPSLQNPMDPEAIQPGLLDDDDRKVLSRPPSRLLLDRRKSRQEPGAVAAPHRIF
jgi:hypothetical protein